jgi:N-acetylglucosamine-6-phosphate deacetylase
MGEAMRLGVRAALVAGSWVEGDVSVEDGRVAEVGLRAAGRGLAAPGLVDLHVNGIAGVDFLHADADGYARAGRALAAHGVTAYQPTFVSSPPAALIEALRVVGRLGRGPGPRVVGVHLEGPFLSPKWAGAHDPQHLLAPDIRLADRLCDAGPVSHVTLAPELPGGLELVGHVVSRGIGVGCGHCDADAPTAHRAFDLGARAVTHVFNAHRRWAARDPGVAGAALVRPEVCVQAIVDLVHLAPEAAYAAFLASGKRFCLVSDSIEGTALGPGSYRLGGRTVQVSQRDARLPDGTLAGSLLTLDRAVRNLVGLGATPAAALHAATAAPAALLRRSCLGRLEPGAPADVVVLDEDLFVRRTLVGGVEVFAA